MKAPEMHTLDGRRVPLMTIAEAAEYLRCTPKALRRRIERAQRDPMHHYFPYRKLGGCIRIMQAELDAWMAEERRARLRIA